MRPIRLALATLAIGAALVAAWPGNWSSTALAQDSTAKAPAPDFAGIDRWFNSRPLSIAGLRGKVVLVEFWTHECINCLHVLPHTKALYDKYAKDGLVIVGVHTPEYDEERDPANVRAAIARYGITWPVAMDNGYQTWNAYGNRFWPALYLVDRDGRVVYSHFGEGNYEETEARVRQLLDKA
jgi:thiol-disulfide isomerase/thioredoxin